jgi:thioredoxin-related protein
MLSKRIPAFLLLFMLSLGAFAQNDKNPKKNATEELEWLDWNEGYEKAVQAGKIVLVDAYTDWCGWCKRMDRDTYSQPEVIKAINADFVPVKFNPEIPGKTYKVGDRSYSPEQLYTLLSQGNATGYPTIYYIFTAKKRIVLDPGYKGPQDFLNILHNMVDEGKK